MRPEKELEIEIKEICDITKESKGTIRFEGNTFTFYTAEHEYCYDDMGNSTEKTMLLYITRVSGVKIIPKYSPILKIFFKKIKESNLIAELCNTDLIVMSYSHNKMGYELDNLIINSILP